MSATWVKLPMLWVTSFTNVSVIVPAAGTLVAAHMSIAASAAAGGTEIVCYATLTFNPIANAGSEINHLVQLPVALVPTATVSSKGDANMYFPMNQALAKNQKIWLTLTGSASNIWAAATVWMKAT